MKLTEIFGIGNKSENYSKIASMIKTDCAPYLKLIGDPSHNILYRGIKKSTYKSGPLEFTKFNVRTDRRPKTTAQGIHELTDNYFYEKFGRRYRSQAIFSYSNYALTASYGAPNVIFPIGDCHICYSESVNDLTLDLNRKYKELQRLKKLPPNAPSVMIDYSTENRDLSPGTDQKLIDFVLDKFKYVEDYGLFKIFDRSNTQDTPEVMISCKEYYAIPIAFKKQIHDFLTELAKS